MKLDRERLIYDLSLAYSQECLRRFDNQQLKSIAEHGGKVYGAFETAWEYFQEIVPVDVFDK